MKTPVLATALCLASLVACRGPNDVSAASGDVSSGERLYSANCASCHGGDALGGSAPALAGISDSNGVIDMILYGGEGMPGFADTLSDADVSDILAWLGSLSGGGGGSGGGEWDDDD